MQTTESLNFPNKSIGGACREYADVFSSNLESPWAFLAISFLTILGAIISHRVTLRSSLSIQPRLYTVLLGESGDTRKSEAIKQTLKFFTNQMLIKDTGICHGVGSAEGLALFLKQHPRTLLVFDEMKTLVNKSNIEGAILLEVANTLFEANRFHSLTKKDQIVIDDGHLSLLTASTLETFGCMFSPRFRDIGFINRLFLVPGDSKKRFSIPKEIPIHTQNLIAEQLLSNLRNVPPSGFIEVSTQGYGVFNEWYLQEQNSGIYSTRLDTYGLRLAVLMAVNEGMSLIDERLMERVVKILDWQRTIREIYDPDDSENTVAKLESAIKKQLLKGPKTKSFLRRYGHGDRSGIYYFNMALNNLLQEKIIRHDSKRDVYFLPLDKLTETVIGGPAAQT